MNVDSFVPKSLREQHSTQVRHPLSSKGATNIQSYSHPTKSNFPTKDEVKMQQTTQNFMKEYESMLKSKNTEIVMLQSQLDDYKQRNEKHV